MNPQTILHLSLVLHITGFTVMAGTVLADFVLNRRMNGYLLSDKLRAVGVLDSVAAFPRLIGIGAGVLVITGVAMVAVYKGVVAEMLWFKIKMILVVLVALNGTLVIRRQGNRLKALLQVNDDRNNRVILALKQRMGVFHGIELFLFLLIFILSVFKFN